MLDLTICTISNNIDKLKNIIEHHNQDIPFVSLYYGDKCEEIETINNLNNVTVYHHTYFNDYASLWNNLFSAISTSYIFWIHDCDTINDDLYSYLVSNDFLELLSNNKPDIISLPVISSCGNVENEDRIIKRTLYPTWKERALPILTLDLVENKRHIIDNDNLNIKTNYEYYSNTKELFDIMLENGESFSVENLLVYTKLMVGNTNEEILNRMCKFIVKNKSLKMIIKNILCYNIAHAYYSINDFVKTKQILSYIDFQSKQPPIYYYYLMGRVYDSYHQELIALKYYEISLTDEIPQLNEIEKKYLYEGEIIIPNILGHMTKLYSLYPELYIKKTED